MNGLESVRWIWKSSRGGRFHLEKDLVVGVRLQNNIYLSTSLVTGKKEKYVLEEDSKDLIKRNL